MIECAKCHGRSVLYLCPLCITELRRQLLRLPRLLGWLDDAAHGQTRLGDDSRGPAGFGSRTPSTDRRASVLVDEIGVTMQQWARPLAATHGLVISSPVNRSPVGYVHTTSDYATFLAANSAVLAKDPKVGDLVAQLRSQVRRGMALVNRRIPPQFCGPCPTLITEHHRCNDAKTNLNTCGYRKHECATRLMAVRGAIEVRCPMCGVTHNVEHLVNHLMARVGEYRCTIPEIHRVLRMLGTPVDISTLYKWASPKVGKLSPAGYLRPDNRRIGAVRHDKNDTPVYRVADARKARDDSDKQRRGRPLKVKGDK